MAAEPGNKKTTSPRVPEQKNIFPDARSGSENNIQLLKTAARSGQNDRNRHRQVTNFVHRETNTGEVARPEGPWSRTCWNREKRGAEYFSGKITGLKCRRTQSLLTGFADRKGSTEGLLGGRLAQRQAALRGRLAAGARSIFGMCSVRADLPFSTSHATRKIFLEIAID